MDKSSAQEKVDIWNGPLKHIASDKLTEFIDSLDPDMNPNTGLYVVFCMVGACLLNELGEAALLEMIDDLKIVCRKLEGQNSVIFHH